MYCIICGQRIYRKASLNWLCQYLSLSIFFFNRFCLVEECGVTPHCLYCDSITLRYHAIPSKWENLSRCSTKLINACKKLPLALNIWYTYISIWGVAFVVPFLCYFQQLQPLVVKTFWTNFCCIVLLYLLVQKVCLRFLKSYFKLEISTFFTFMVSLLAYTFN